MAAYDDNPLTKRPSDTADATEPGANDQLTPDAAQPQPADDANVLLDEQNRRRSDRHPWHANVHIGVAEAASSKNRVRELR